MSNIIFSSSDNIRLASFNGGSELGRCISVVMDRETPLSDVDSVITSIQLTETDARALAIDLINFANEVTV